MENYELFLNDEAIDNSFDSEYDVNMELDNVNPWMLIAIYGNSTAA